MRNNSLSCSFLYIQDINFTFLEWHPRTDLNLQSNALGFRSNIILTAASLSATLSSVFEQLLQLQAELQTTLAVKH